MPKGIKGFQLNEKNPNWKGSKVGIDALHEWVKNRKNKPKKCENCKKIKEVELTNKSGKYKRSLNDWEWLCRSCHMIKDGRMKNLKQFN
ncbi:hypothetical protein LCGC14_2949860 [marine sediment metagenome]|uniref:Uncharacterized protein n=1 Tax=marine sediment metagenome TaxID=412755 RepID=A0A0F8XG80_9ZZZZ